MIKLTHIKKSFGERHSVLKDVSFEVEEGEFAFLAGSSGVGKTTLMSILFRELLPSSGDGVVAGFRLSEVTPRRVHLFRRKVGVVFQDARLLPNHTVLENIVFVLRAFGYKKAEIKEMAEESLRLVGMENKMDMMPRYLSGGEQQKVAIARAIVNNPSLILADEPAGNLDSEAALDVMDIFYRAVSNGTTVLLSTHDFEITRFIKTKTLILQKGMIKRVN